MEGQMAVLLVPVGGISAEAFEAYAAEIRRIGRVRLEELSADTAGDERARFMPNAAALSTGHVHVVYPSHPPPHAHVPLSLLRPSHFPLAVAGVATCTDPATLPAVLASFNGALLDLFPAQALFPLARTCFVFEQADDATSLNAGHDLGLVVVPSVMGNKNVYIRTKIADLCSQIIAEFGVLVQNLESPLGNEYLNASLMPLLPPLSEIPTPLSADPSRDPAPTLSSHNSQPEVAKTPFTLGATPVMKRNSSTGNYRQSALGVSSPSKKRLSGIGAASSPARLFKIYGDFYLLAGRIADADQWYQEALSMFKTVSDPVWQAATLEALTSITILNAWSEGQGLNDSVSPSGEKPWSDISEKLNQATSLYHKAPSDGDHDYALLAFLYTNCVLRHTHILYAVWSAKGWGPLAFTSMLHAGPSTYVPPTLSHDDATSNTNLERLSSISGIPRYSISSVLSQVHGPWLLHLGPRERISVLERTASIYSSLGYKRKEAYILREVLGCVLDLVVCGREEDGLNRGASTGLGTGGGLGIQIHEPSSAATESRAYVGIRVSESADGNQSVLVLLKYICMVLGIDLDSVQLLDAESGPVIEENEQVVSNQYEDEMLEGYKDVHGWPELQVGVVREAVAVAEALPDFPAVAQFALSALKTMQNILAPGDQYHLYVTSGRALLTAQRRGIMKLAEYWSGRPVLNVSISPLPFVRTPTQKPISALRAQTDVTPILMGATDPFLYNPRKAAAGQGKVFVVHNETLEFEVILQNPYVFDLELQLLSLSTTGVKFESQPAHAVIPANTYQHVVLSGTPVETGVLTVRGCLVQAPGGQVREFVLPVSSAAEEERLARARSSIACEIDRSKYPGLEGLANKAHQQRGSLPPRTLTYLQCHVIPEQPMMRIRRTSLTHGAVMLFDGEVSPIQITLENVSTLPVDFIRLAFDDSTIGPAQQALSDGEMSVYDTYETEYDLIHRPMFKWTPESDVNVPPGQKTTMSVTCLGKVGCTHATIHISYGFVHRPTQPADPPSREFYVRQLAYPVMVTVYQMLDCGGMNILPLPTSSSSLHPPDTVRDENSSSAAFPAEPDQSEWCLFSIEIRNLYGQPFDVLFDRIENDSPVATAQSTVPPGSTSRIVLPIKKFLLPESQISQPIPTLSDRQFVVTKSSLSATEERSQRELFWYREELFKRVHGRWKESGGIRFGDLSLRQQRLTLPMLELLRTETAQIHLSLVDAEGGSFHSPSSDKYYSPPNDFVYLQAKVTNASPSPLIFCLDLEIEPSEHVIYEAILSNQPLGRLKSGETSETLTALCFLVQGRFQVSARVRTVASEVDEYAGGSDISIVVRSSSEINHK